MRTYIALVSLVATVLTACAGGSAPFEPEDIAAPADVVPEDGKTDATGRKECLAGFTPSPRASWRHTSSRFIAALGHPVHSASDVIVNPGQTAPLAAKFAYGGALSKDLEDEWVWVFVHDCAAWRYVGWGRTDGDGRVTFNLAPGLSPGVYDVRIEVVGDASYATLRLWVLPSGTHLSVFDIDGTLTTDDGEIFEEILLGWTPEAYPAALDVTWAERGRDEVIVYLTGRPEILAAQTRSWLNARGLPAGAVKLTRTAGEVLPTNSGVGTYKTNYLAGLRGLGLILDDAFGNAGTDIYAYERNGIPKSRTWIIGPNAGQSGTIPVSGGWSAVADRLDGEPMVDQPGW
jgi:hypothetical protein